MCLRRALVSSTTLFICIWPQSAHTSPTGPVIALHAKTHTSKGATICGTWAPSDLDCTAFNTAGRTGVATDVYLVVVNPVVAGADSGVAGVRLGIDYNGEAHEGVDVFSWTLCADADYSMDGWPTVPGRGNTIVWLVHRDPSLSNCQTNYPGESGVQGVAGAFYVYAYDDDVFSAAPFFSWDGDLENDWVKWGDPELEFVSCSGWLTYLDLGTTRGAIHFSADGTTQGFNPCSGEGTPPSYRTPDPVTPPPPPPPPPSQMEPTILLHIGEVGPRGGSCSDAPTSIDSVVTSVAFSDPGAEYNVFLLATPKVPSDSIGVGAIQFGIEFGTGLEVLDWHKCVSAELPHNDWPASGSGTTLATGFCDGKEVTVLGYLRVAINEPTVLAIIGHPQTGIAKMADCISENVLKDLSLSRAGWISFGGAALGQDDDGCNPALEPCARAPVPVQSTTWGKLKSRYR